MNSDFKVVKNKPCYRFSEDHGTEFQRSSLKQTCRKKNSNGVSVHIFEALSLLNESRIMQLLKDADVALSSSMYLMNFM